MNQQDYGLGKDRSVELFRGDQELAYGRIFIGDDNLRDDATN
jgi:hypothetical protein